MLRRADDAAREERAARDGLARDRQEDEVRAARREPLKRWQEPADIADMAVFLASARANNVTGQTINVDGGFVMHW